MKLEHRDAGWFITDTPEGCEEMGPYDTRGEAQEDLTGVKKFLDGTCGKISCEKVKP